MILFFQILFAILKFSLIFVLLAIGVLIILNSKEFYSHRLIRSNIGNREYTLCKIRLFLGFTYILIGLGIMFNYLTYLLIWIFSNFDGLLLISLRLTISILPEIYHQNILLFIEIFHPVLAILSLMAIMQYIMTLFYLINKNRVLNNPKKSINLLIISMIEIIFFGMECLPYLL